MIVAGIVSAVAVCVILGALANRALRSLTRPEVSAVSVFHPGVPRIP